MSRMAGRSRRASEIVSSSWVLARESLARPYRVTVPMVAFVALIPLYVFIPGFLPAGPRHVPELSWDRLIPLRPGWALVYGTLYLFLILLPVLVVRQEDLIRRTVFAYLVVWTTAYVCFVAYPTVAPRPAKLLDQGFAAWGLLFLYGADPPYNCFPSLHVAHSFVSALACGRVHRGLGIAAVLVAVLVAISTLYSKQHYLLDVIAGVLLALAADFLLLRGSARVRVPDGDRRAAPVLALVAMAIVGLGLACFWVAYLLKRA
jgi:membrane-associated phospholipid phosphatase